MLKERDVEPLSEELIEVLSRFGFEELDKENEKPVHAERLGNLRCGLPLSIVNLKTKFSLWSLPFDFSYNLMEKKDYPIGEGRNTNISGKGISKLLDQDHEAVKFTVSKGRVLLIPFVKEFLEKYLKAYGFSIPEQPVNSESKGGHDFIESKNDGQHFKYKEIPIKEAQKRIRTFQQNLRKQLLRDVSSCELTGLEIQELLVASHIKPVQFCDETEMQDVENVLLLSPNMDRLFDQGFISFEDDGKILISDSLGWVAQKTLNIGRDLRLKRGLGERKKAYMKYHRENVFRR